jgi:NADH dehydrogenase FAD-containing subunit
MKKVVIVGGGIAGKKLAENLDKKKIVEVVLVEPKEYFEVPFAQLRSLVDPKDFSPTIRKKYSELIPGVRHIMKKATGIQGNNLKLDDGTDLDFDYLILATGSSFSKWPYLKSSEPLMVARQEEVLKEGSKLEKANSVLIIGGGSVGVEFAGEIADTWADKKVVLVHGGSRILNGLSEKMSARSEKILKEMGVEIFTNTHLKENKDGTWSDESGKTYKADIVYQAVGMSLSSAWLDGSKLEKTERGAVKVGSDLRVIGIDNIFALGDINDVPEMKLGVLAGNQATLTAKNIQRLIKDPSARLTPYKPSKPMSFIPIGRKAGAVQLPFGHPHFLIAIKQKDLFVSKTLS